MFDDNKVTLATEKQVLGADAYLLFYMVRALGAGGDEVVGAGNAPM